MIPFQPNQTMGFNQMMGIMGGLPQGGVRPFQPSRGPTSFANRARFGGLMMNNPFQGMGFGMGGQPQPQPQPQPGFNTSGTYQDYMDSFNANPLISDLLHPMGPKQFNEQFGGQPQPPQVSPQPMTPMTPTFAPQPQPARVMTEDERRMLLTTANPFSSGPDAINPMMGNRFNQARMEAGMGGIASLAPRQPTMNTPFGGMGGLADLFRQRMQQFQTTQPPNPLQLTQLSNPGGARTPSGGPTTPFLGLAGFGNLMMNNPFQG